MLRIFLSVSLSPLRKVISGDLNADAMPARSFVFAVSQDTGIEVLAPKCVKMYQLLPLALRYNQQNLSTLPSSH